MSKPVAVPPDVFDKVAELVGAEETAEGLWDIFDKIMCEYDMDYLDYDGDQAGYLFMIFIFGYCQGGTDMVLLEFDEGKPEFH